MGFVQKLAMSHEKNKTGSKLTESNGKITRRFGNGGWQNPSSPSS
jgi:hypothetical protein